MDQSITRRSQPCWYRVDGVGNIAINDSFMLEGAIYHLIKTHFRREKYYVDLLELFHGVRIAVSSAGPQCWRMLQVSYKTEMGQLVDLISAPEDSVDLNRFSLAK
jgi:farnesyl diphosphate synthase